MRDAYLAAVACLVLVLTTPAMAQAGAPQTAAAESPSVEDIELLPFDERVYDLTYEIFLNNGNLADAYRVAAAAVRQRPDDPKWRQRLAQVSEWSQKPAQALSNWRDLARSGDDKAAWEGVRRLAPALFDYDLFIEVLERDARTHTLNEKQLKLLVDAYERAGRPQDAIVLLRSLNSERPRREYLENVVYLEQRLGRSKDVLATFYELTAVYGPNTDRAISAASLYVLQGDFESAYYVLTQARPVAEPDETAFWKMLAELAEHTQRADDARAAYMTIAERDKSDVEMLLRLLNLLEYHPQDALRIGEEAWRLHHDPRFLLHALEACAQLRKFEEGEKLLRSASPQDLQPLNRNSRFLMARGALRQGQGHLQAALVDYEAALILSDYDPEVQLNLLWLLIEMREDERIRNSLDKVLAIRPRSGELTEALAAAYITLEEHAKALPLFRQRLEAHREDPVWLVDYAEVLAASGYTDQAQRVRQHALGLLKKLAPANKPRWAWAPAARLALAHTPGDPTARIVLALLTPGEKTNAVDDVTADVLLLWLMRSEQYDRVRLWFWRRYVHALANPVWADFAVALIQQDRPKLADMLADNRTRPLTDKYDRVEAPILLDEPFLARELAFATLERLPDDDTLQEELVKLLPETARIVGVQGAYATRGVIEGPETRIFGRWPLTRGLALDSSIQLAHWDEVDDSAITHVPETDVAIDAQLTWRHLRLARTSVRAGLRDALRTFPVAEIAHERLVGRTRARVSLGTGLLAEEGSAIRVGGRQDRLQLELNRSLSRRTFINAELAASRYDTQDGEDLGTSRHAIVTIGHKLRIDYPDYTVRLVGGVYDYSLEEGVITGAAARLVPPDQIPTASFFLSEDFALVGLLIGFGDDIRENYTRRWWPFMDVGVTYNTASGFGFGVSGGIAGRVIGDDHLALSFNRVEGGSGLGETDTIVSLTYRYFY